MRKSRENEWGNESLVSNLPGVELTRFENESKPFEGRTRRKYGQFLR